PSPTRRSSALLSFLLDSHRLVSAQALPVHLAHSLASNKPMPNSILRHPHISKHLRPKVARQGRLPTNPHFQRRSMQHNNGIVRYPARLGSTVLILPGLPYTSLH